jgi:HEAT repeat protein
MVESPDPEQAKAAIRALGRIPDAGSWDPLQAALGAGDEGRRAAAVLSIVHLGGSRAIETLEWTAAADASRTVAESALGGLITLAADDTLGPEAARALVALAGDPGRRELVVAALATLPPAAIDLVAERGLKDPRPSVRVAILEAFGRARCHEASRWLEAALSDKDAEVRLAALNELRHLGTQGVERSLVVLARTDPDPAIQRAALALLKAPPEGPLPAPPAGDAASAARRERPR